MVKRTPAEPKATWAGGIPQVSFAMLKTWMNTSSVGRTRSFDCWDVEAIVEAGGVCGKNAWDGGCEGRNRMWAVIRLVLTPPFGAERY
jgi:hypothetical protein